MTDKTNKRKCPSSPEEDKVPMVDGIMMNGYLRESKRIVGKFYGQKKMIQSEAGCMLEGVG